MVIQLGTTTLCAGSTRNSTGSPIGPDNVTVNEQPGAALRDYIGADRTQGEHVGVDHGTLSFQVTRVFGSLNAATAYAMTGHRSEPTSGALTVTPDGGSAVTLFAAAAVTSKQISQRGVAVVVNYTIEG